MLSKVKEYRERAGLTQTELALKVGLSQSAVAKWETAGYTPRAATLIRVADVLGVSLDQLYGREPPGVVDCEAS